MGDMDKNDFWTTVRNKGEADDIASVGALRAALVFGAVVIAAAVIATPLLASRDQRMLGAGGRFGFDAITTGSTPSGYERAYTIRRSVTQPMPDALCIIDANGHHRGDC